jgi:hypothetical protein
LDVLCVLFFSGESDRGGVLEPESLLRLKRKRSKMMSRLSVFRIRSKIQDSTNTAPSGSRKPSIAVGVLYRDGTDNAVTIVTRSQTVGRNE